MLFEIWNIMICLYPPVIRVMVMVLLCRNSAYSPGRLQIGISIQSNPDKVLASVLWLYHDEDFTFLWQCGCAIGHYNASLKHYLHHLTSLLNIGIQKLVLTMTTASQYQSRGMISWHLSEMQILPAVNAAHRHNSARTVFSISVLVLSSRPIRLNRPIEPIKTNMTNKSNIYLYTYIYIYIHIYIYIYIYIYIF